MLEGDEYAVHAERLDGDVWEVQVGVLQVGTLTDHGPAARIIRKGSARR
jgi:hypothetical protein